MEHLLSIRYKTENEAARIWVYDESAFPGLDKTIAVSSFSKDYGPGGRQFMPLTTEQCREVAIALCPPGEIAREWQAFLGDAESLLAAPEVNFRSVLDSLRCGVDMLREACSMVEATQAAEDEAPVNVRPTGRNRKRYRLEPVEGEASSS